MDRALSCAWYVGKGLAIVISFTACMAIATLALILAGLYTARFFGLGDDVGYLFMLIYMVLIFGIGIGIDMCRENS